MKSMEGSIILITGSTDGIGYITALRLSEMNAHVLVHGRNNEKVIKVVNALKEKSGNQNIDGFVADLAGLAEVRKLAGEIKEKFPRIDILINNAGVGFAGDRYSKDGFELRFAVNYLAPFLLSSLLMPLLEASANSRIVNVASGGQSPVDLNDLMLENKFNGTEAYCRSKLALVMFTMEIAKRMNKDRITANSLHPGTYLDTNMVRMAGISPLGKPESGAEAVVSLAISPTLKGVTGKFYNVKTEARAHSQAYDEAFRKKLWDKTLELTNAHQ